MLALTPLFSSCSNISASAFTLKWNVMPHVGLLAYGDEQRTREYHLPARLDNDGKVVKLYF